VPVKLAFDPIKSLVKIDNKIQTLQQFIKDKDDSVRIVPLTVAFNFWQIIIVPNLLPHEV